MYFLFVLLPDDLPINFNKNKHYPHMNVVEKDKLEWTKDLPPMKDTLMVYIFCILSTLFNVITVII